MLLRQRYVVAAVAATTVAAVVALMYFETAAYESSSLVRFDPVWMSSLHPPETPVPDRAGAMAAHAAEADGPLRTVMNNGFEFPFSYTVVANAEAGTLRFDATAESATEAQGIARAAAARFAGEHNSVAKAQRTLDEARAELAEIDNGTDAGTDAGDVGARATVLRERIEVYEAEIPVIEAGVAEVDGEPTLPTDPVSPDFYARVVATLVQGLVLGVLIAWLVDRRRSRHDHSDAGEPQTRPAAWWALAATSVVGGAVVLAALVTGLHSLWKVRTVTNDQVEEQIACVRSWLADLPAGSTVYAVNSAWRPTVTEVAFPHVQVATTPEEADYQLEIVGAGPDGENCAGYRLELTES